MSFHFFIVDHKNIDGKQEITHQRDSKNFDYNHWLAYFAVRLATYHTCAHITAQNNKIKKTHLACILANATIAMLQNRADKTKLHYTLKNINNLYHKLRQKKLQENTLVDAMIQKLEKNHFFFQYQINADNHLIRLFYVHL